MADNSHANRKIGTRKRRVYPYSISDAIAQIDLAEERREALYSSEALKSAEYPSVAIDMRVKQAD
jgi:hypothetical protein